MITEEMQKLEKEGVIESLVKAHFYLIKALLSKDFMMMSLGNSALRTLIEC